MRNFFYQTFTSTEALAAILGVITVVSVITIFVFVWNYWRICQQQRRLQRRRDRVRTVKRFGLP